MSSRGPKIKMEINHDRIARVLADPEISIKTAMQRFHISHKRVYQIMEEHGIERKRPAKTGVYHR